MLAQKKSKELEEKAKLASTPEAIKKQQDDQLKDRIRNKNISRQKNKSKLQPIRGKKKNQEFKCT